MTPNVNFFLTNIMKHMAGTVDPQLPIYTICYVNIPNVTDIVNNYVLN